jgi:hypothetical protein
MTSSQFAIMQNHTCAIKNSWAVLMAAVDLYVVLETFTREANRVVCNHYCGRCISFCCKEEICRETMESTWLMLVLRRSGHRISDYSRSTGWVGFSGCRLKAGRPPVCYEFLCNGVIKQLESADKLFLKQISQTLSIAGSRALGTKHVVDLSCNDLLTRANHERLYNRITKCLQTCMRLSMLVPNIDFSVWKAASVDNPRELKTTLRLFSHAC